MKPKNFPLQNKFTWGFELEGKFKRNFLDELSEQKNDERTALTDFNLMGDGSVNVRTPTGYDPHTQEVSLGIFPTLHTFYKYLSKFTADVYEYNSSCGMHIHMKEKEGTFLTENIYRWGLIETIQEWAINNLPVEEQDRLYDNHFCQRYPNFQTALSDLKGSAKYRAIARRHPIGRPDTTELRLFSPRNRVRASKQFLEKFLKELNQIKDEPVKEEETIELEPERIELELDEIDATKKTTKLSEEEINRSSQIHQEGNETPDTIESLAEAAAEARNIKNGHTIYNADDPF